MTQNNKEKSKVIFLGGKSVRAYWDENSDNWYFSIVDIIEITGKSTDSRNYWKVLKNRLKTRAPQLVTACNQLKLLGKDGKYYLTDVAECGQIIKILAYIDEDSRDQIAEYFKKFENEIYESPEDTDQFELLIDMYDDGPNIVIRAMLGGVDPKDIHISTWTEKILIKGERKNHFKNHAVEYLANELLWHKFSRTIELPYKVETGKIKITSDDQGGLSIKLPKLLRHD